MADEGDVLPGKKRAPKPRSPKKGRAGTTTRAAAADAKSPRKRAKAAKRAAAAAAAPVEKTIATATQEKMGNAGAAALKVATSKPAKLAGAVTALGIAAAGIFAGVAAVRRRSAAKADKPGDPGVPKAR